MLEKKKSSNKNGFFRILLRRYRGYALLIFLLKLVHYLLYAVSRPKLIFLEHPETQTMLDMCPTLRNRYWPTFWCTNAHMQIFLFWLLNNGPFCPRVPLRRELLTMSDGGLVSLDWIDEDELVLRNKGKAFTMKDVVSSSPIVLILHGITGSSEDCLRLMLSVRRRGWRPVVMNRRGHGGIPLLTPKFSFFGDTGDARAVVTHILQQQPEPVSLHMIGISAGSGLLVRYLGEEAGGAPIVSAVAVSPGYDTVGPEGCWGKLDWPYNRVMASFVKDYFLTPATNQAVLRGSHSPSYEGAVNASDMVELSERVAPFARHRRPSGSSGGTSSGDGDASGAAERRRCDSCEKQSEGGAGEDASDDTTDTCCCCCHGGLKRSASCCLRTYNEATNPMAVAHHIAVPTLVINSTDDPLCTHGNIKRDLFRTVPRAVLALVSCGSHVAFWTGLLRPRSWADDVGLEFMAANQLLHEQRAQQQRQQAEQQKQAAASVEEKERLLKWLFD